MSQEIRVPDLGNIPNALVIELSIAEGQSIEKDGPVLTLESDKAAMEIPAPAAGIIEKVCVKKGDKLGTGDLIALLKAEGGAATLDAASTKPDKKPETQSNAVPKKPVAPDVHVPDTQTISHAMTTNAINGSAVSVAESKASSSAIAYAGPSVRQLAHVLGVDLHQVSGTGHRHRITREDVEKYVKNALKHGAGTAAGALAGIPLSPPDIDYSIFGEVERQPLSRIKQRTAQNMQAAWLQIPRVSHVDEADITDLEFFRKELAGSQNIKLSILPFILKAFSYTLKAFPAFNASLTPAMDALILKHFVHLGVAVDTPQGLVVPVIKDVDQKGILQLAKELDALSQKARDQKLMPQDFQGSSSTVSSLGGIGGTVFTPIVNLPNVAILGVCRSAMKPVYRDNEFVPRLILPLTLSYDHRAIDGAEAARFMVYLCRSLTDLRRILL